MVYRYQNEENLEILTEIVILTDFGQISKIEMSVTLQSTPAWAMKSWSAGFRSRNLQYTTRAGHSAKENSGVGCACTPTIVSNIEDFAIFRNGHPLQPGWSLRWSEGLTGKLRLGARLNIVVLFRACLHNLDLVHRVLNLIETWEHSLNLIGLAETPPPLSEIL